MIKMHRNNMQLIRTLAFFKPKSSSDIQYYNFLREFCILNNCSVEYGIENAGNAWRKLGEKQRKCYESEMCAVLPIPVPLNQIYDALRDERSGLLSLGKIESGKTIRYVVKSYNPKVHERNRTQREMERKYLAFFENAADIAIDSGFSARDHLPRKIRKRKHTTLMEEKKTSSKKHNHKKQNNVQRNIITKPPELIPETLKTNSGFATLKQSTVVSATPETKRNTQLNSFDDGDFGGAGDAINKTRTKRQKKSKTKTKYIKKSKKLQNYYSSDNTI